MGLSRSNSGTVLASVASYIVIDGEQRASEGSVDDGLSVTWKTRTCAVPPRSRLLAHQRAIPAPAVVISNGAEH